MKRISEKTGRERQALIRELERTRSRAMVQAVKIGRQIRALNEDLSLAERTIRDCDKSIDALQS